MKRLSSQKKKEKSLVDDGWLCCLVKQDKMRRDRTGSWNCSPHQPVHFRGIFRLASLSPCKRTNVAFDTSSQIQPSLRSWPSFVVAVVILVLSLVRKQDA